jgi:hypothetical protein
LQFGVYNSYSEVKKISTGRGGGLEPCSDNCILKISRVWTGCSTF